MVRYLLKLDSKRNDYLLFAGVWRQREKIDQFLQTLKKDKLNFSQKIVWLPPRLANLVINDFRIPIEKFIGEVDVFHASNWTTPKTKAKLVTTVHDLTPILFPASFPKLVIKNFKKNLQLIEKTASMISVDSQATKGDLLKNTRISSEKVKVVYLAAEKHFRPLRNRKILDKVKAKYKISGDYILSVGTQEPRKNIKRLIEAFLALDSQFSTQLVLVGKYGWGEESRFLDNNSVICPGFVDDQDLPILYSGATVFVYPSLYEGFGLPILEAMQCNCPVITSNCSSMAEIAGQAALLIDPTNKQSLTLAIKKVLKDKTLRQDLRNKGRKQAEKFSWEKTAKDTLALYQKL